MQPQVISHKLLRLYTCEVQNFMIGLYGNVQSIDHKEYIYYYVVLEMYPNVEPEPLFWVTVEFDTDPDADDSTYLAVYDGYSQRKIEEGHHWRDLENLEPRALEIIQQAFGMRRTPKLVRHMPVISWFTTLREMIEDFLISVRVARQ